MKKFFGRIFGFLNSVFFWAIWGIGRGFFKIYFRLSTENHPKLSSAYIVAANHSSLLDGFLLQASLKRRASFFLTVLFFNRRGLNWFFKMVHAIPIYDAGGNKNALFDAAQRLRRGELVAIFPEGGVSLDGKIGPGKPGVARLAQDSQAPVVPARIFGSFESMPRGAIFPKPNKIRVVFGSPIEPPTAGESSRREESREFSAKVMQAISSLL